MRHPLQARRAIVQNTTGATVGHEAELWRMDRKGASFLLQPTGCRTRLGASGCRLLGSRRTSRVGALIPKFELYLTCTS